MRQAIDVPQRDANIWRSELGDVVRGISGGFLFGIPLLYTMEVWWLGAHMETWRLLLLLLLSLAVNYMLNHFAGFHEQAPAFRPLTDALEAIALGIIAAGVTLFVLGEVRVDMPLRSIISLITLESVPFSLGVSIANGFLQGNNGAQEQGRGHEEGAGRRQSELHGTLLDAGATVGGALFVASSITPTEEIPMLAAQRSPLWLIALIIFSLLVSYAITFEAGFANQQARLRQQGIFQRPLSETVFSYLLSLVLAAILLWLFKQLEVADPWTVWLERSIVLALPAAIGGSAGRLTIGA